MAEHDIVIIGAGPCGLGAAWRLMELGHKRFTVLEQASYPGGLAASFKNRAGWTFDIGGHVIFSHYPAYDSILRRVLGKDIVHHHRSSFVRTLGKWVPYPFQNNIHRLPREVILECLDGLARTNCHKSVPDNFKEWALATFGYGIARYFMIPYNEKVWGLPLEKLGAQWISERVGVVDFKKTLRKVLDGKDETEWGPNARFSYPSIGGTGEIFRRMAARMEDKIRYNQEVIGIDAGKRLVHLRDGMTIKYDHLLNTMPLDHLARVAKGLRREAVDAAKGLMFNSGIMVGIGVRREIRAKRCWVYFPDPSAPFYRVTYLTNYSRSVAPIEHTLLMAEITFSKHRPMPKRPVEQTVDALIEMGLMRKDDRKLVAVKWSHIINRSYPLPSIDRDKRLRVIHPSLEKHGILSRGRFGGWVYEVGNTDHAVMMGIEAANRMLDGRKETVFPFASRDDE